MEFFNTWIQSIVIAVIISTILEMIIPEGNNKKYIKTVIGIYILFTIIAPIISKVSKKEIKLENLVEIDNKTEVSSLYESPNSQIQELYIINMKKDIESKVYEKGYNVHNIHLTIIGENEYNLSSMNIEISKRESTTNNNSTNINTIEIDNINIGNRGTADNNIIQNKEQYNSNKENTNKTNPEEVDNLKSYLSSNYGLNIDKIIIIIKETIKK